MKRTMLLVAGLACLVGCESTEGWRLRTMAGGGASRLTDEFEGNSSSFSGLQASVRAEVANPIDYMKNTEVGLRLIAGVHQFDETEDGVTVDFDTIDLGLAPVFRGFLDVSSSVRLYGEVFGGYRQVWGDLTVSASGMSETVRGDDGGIFFGGGIGAEFAISHNSSFLLGAEWSRNRLKDEGETLDLDDFSLLVGMGGSSEVRRPPARLHMRIALGTEVRFSVRCRAGVAVLESRS